MTMTMNWILGNGATDQQRISTRLTGQCQSRGPKSGPARIGLRVSGALLLGWLLLPVTGCEKQAKPTPTSVGLVTQGGNAEAASTYADANLAELTRELRRWIVKTKQRPTSFEDFAAKAQIQVPPAPAGKKYAISKEMRVVLADR